MIDEREEVAAPASRGIRSDLPVATWKSRGRAGVVKLNTSVVFFNANCIEAEVLVVYAIETGANAALYDEVISDYR